MSNQVEFPIPIPYSARLFRLLRKLDLDVIHSHHPLLLGDVAAHFARKKGIPLVYTFHTQLEEYSHYIPLNQEMVKGMARSRMSHYAQKCDLVLAPSPSIRSLLDSYGITTRVETVPNAIDTSRFANPSVVRGWRQQLEIPTDAVVSLSVGRLGQEKNLDFLLQCFSTLCKRQGERYLVLVGDGTERARLEALARELGVHQRVRFTGAIPYCEMPSIYAACDLFTICSTTEVKPLVVLEALASGLPSLAISACGTVDTLHHGRDGWLCSSGDPEAFVEGWERLTDDRELRLSLGRQARLTSQRYSLEFYLDRLTGLYQETIEAMAMGATG